MGGANGSAPSPPQALPLSIRSVCVRIVYGVVARTGNLASADLHSVTASKVGSLPCCMLCGMFAMESDVDV
jgi:hypothetical protein